MRSVLAVLALCCASARAGDMIFGAHNGGINRWGLEGQGGLWWGQDSYAFFLCNHYTSVTGLLDMGLRMMEFDTYWSLHDDGSPNTLGGLNDILSGVGLDNPAFIALVDGLVELIGLPTRLKFNRGSRRPIVAHSVPALGFSYLEDVLTSVKGWADAHPEETVYLRFNHRRGPGGQFDASDATALEELVASTLGGTGTFLGYTEPAWTDASTSGVHVWLSTRIQSVPADEGLAEPGPIAGSRTHATRDNTYEVIREGLGDPPLLVVESDFWTPAQLREIESKIAAEEDRR